MGKFQRKRSVSPIKNQSQNTSQSPSNHLPHYVSQATINNARPRVIPKPRPAPIKLPSEKDNLLSTEKKNPPLNHRNSTLSIREDPFFRNYTSPQTLFLARELESAISAGYDENERFITEPSLIPPLSDLPADDSSPTDLNKNSESKTIEVNLAVIGVTGVGKSTLIQGALGLSSLPSCLLSTLRFSNKDMVHNINFLEMELEATLLNWGKKLSWPQNINGYIVSQIHGVLLLYDITNKKSLERFPEILNKITHLLLPTVLVSCKCDLPLDLHQVNIDDVKKTCTTGIDIVETAAKNPASARICLSKILRVILGNKNQSPKITETINLGIKPVSPSSNTSSELGLKYVYPNSNHHQSSATRRSKTDSSLKMIISTAPMNPPLLNFLSFSAWAGTQPTPEKTDTSKTPNPLKDHLYHLDTFKQSNKETTGFHEKQRDDVHSPNSQRIFIDIDLSDIDLSLPFPEESPILNGNDKHHRPTLQSNDLNIIGPRCSDDSEKMPIVMSTRLEDYVDRLVCQTISKSDKIFIEVFLCLYRQFATPKELLSSLLQRLENFERERSSHYLTRVENQFRALNIILKWITTYPGDLAGPSTSQNLLNYLNSIIDQPEFTLAAIEIKLKHQIRVVIDDDTRWGKADPDIEMMVDESTSETACKSPCASNLPGRKDADPHLLPQCVMKDRNSETNPRNSRVDNWGQLGSPVSSFSRVEEFDKEAATIIPRNSIPLSKNNFCVFMQIPEEEISNEITRMDWVMFSAIRPRDLVRHVCLVPHLKKSLNGLESVKRMIDHFNHIAAWVANMILMRDKAKHRALVLEKFVKIALKLRQLSNFNDLAAVLAGINNTAVYRLSFTWSLVPSDILEQLNGLMILMGTQRGYIAYRLAWKESNSFRIPFLPLHRRDLVVAEETSHRFLGLNEESINIKKFEVFSEIISPIIRSQMVPCPILMESKSSRDLILDCKILNDEELYQRSLTVEHSGSPVTEFGKKRFFWF